MKAKLSKRNRWFLKKFLKLAKRGHYDGCPYTVYRMPKSYRDARELCHFCCEQFPKTGQRDECPLSCLSPNRYTNIYVVDKAKRLLREAT